MENQYDVRLKAAHENGYREGYIQALKDFKVKESFSLLLQPVKIIKVNEEENK